MVKTVFLDRDGVINYLIQRDNITTAPWEKTEFKFIPGSISAILKLKTLRLKVIVVTNQPDVNDGMMELETLEYFNQKLLDVGVDEVLVAYNRNSLDYKPNNGMLEKTIEKYRLNRSECVLVGDRWKDIVAGNSSKITTIYCSENVYFAPEPYQTVLPDYQVSTLLKAVNLIEGIMND